jgi:hypothetical protein|tara:strand:+ start:13416 stop:14282 length:867 start_codon:yes stop_codon:yes gene_type:complete
MIDRIDRVQIAVKSIDKAAATFNLLLGAEVIDRSYSQYLNASRIVMALGESEIELCQADGAGYTADFLTTNGEGLMIAGLCCANPDQLKNRLRAMNFTLIEDGDQFYLPSSEHYGMPFVITATKSRNRIGAVSFLYEVTHSLFSDWRKVASHYAGVFDLDPNRFSSIQSKLFGYDGCLTLFDPPNRLDRIELAQVVNNEVPMGRWTQRRGDSLYMCSCESHDIRNLVERFLSAGVRWTPRGNNKELEGDGFWSHPADLHGVLLGVSRTTVAWEFSGRPEFVDPPALKV